MEAAKWEEFLSFTYPIVVTNNIEAPVSLVHSHLFVQRRSSAQYIFHKGLRKAFICLVQIEQLKFDMSDKQTKKIP